MSDEIYLKNDDVVSFEDTTYSLANAQTARASEIKSSLLKTWFVSHLSGWIADGIGCRVLLVQGGGWQVGKIRFQMQFVPDKPEVGGQESSTVASEPQSPLDDLRSQLNPE
ncbi:MAG: KGK domain-containing protein [Nostoc sp.]|uniref:KGK domain-containing protein n=1 Tax=Nostoc sp. TaxID=1180 RepID=UPI002FFB685A